MMGIGGTVMIVGAVVDACGEMLIAAVTTALGTSEAGSDVDEFEIAEPTCGPDETCDAPHPATLINVTAIIATSRSSIAALGCVQLLPDLTNFS